MTRTKSIYLALLAVLLSPMAANADLIDMGATTVDDATNLEWLDITESQGFSVDAILGGAGGFLADGWQYATSSQVCGLLGYIGISISGTGDTSCFSSQGDFTSNSYTDTFIDLLGANITTDGLTPPRDVFNAVVGFFDSGEFGSGRTGGACIQTLVNVTAFCSFQPFPPDGFFRNDWVGTGTGGFGSFLVRDYTGGDHTVPEPGTLALLGLGLVGMAARRRRKTASV